LRRSAISRSSSGCHCCASARICRVRGRSAFGIGRKSLSRRRPGNFAMRAIIGCTASSAPAKTWPTETVISNDSTWPMSIASPRGRDARMLRQHFRPPHQHRQIGQGCAVVEDRVDQRAVAPPHLAIVYQHAGTEARRDRPPLQPMLPVIRENVDQHMADAGRIADDEDPMPQQPALRKRLVEQRCRRTVPANWCRGSLIISQVDKGRAAAAASPRPAPPAQPPLSISSAMVIKPIPVPAATQPTN